MSSKLKVQELRDELAKRGLDTTGLKPALVTRLDEAIASDNAPAKDEAVDSNKKNDNSGDAKKTHARDCKNTDTVTKRMKLEDIDRMSAEELKRALVVEGCSQVGSKAVLKKRLISALKDADPQDGDKAEDSEEKIVTSTMKGRAVLDPNLPDQIKADYHVLEEGDQVYDAMLNQTNVGGNNNKYYVIQALENDAGSSYLLFTRWGRVGAKGQSKLLTCSSKNHAIGQFQSVFYDKTRNAWDDRHTFKSFPGKYTWLEMDYDSTDKPQEVGESTKSTTKAPVPRKPSKLKPPVEELISLICNINMMKQQMMEIGYDARKMPLGKLSKSTILKGYEVLKKIATALESHANRSQLADLTSEFYTVIPHDFGFKKMSEFVIDSTQILKKKLEMVEALGEIELASKLLEVNEEEEEDPAFFHYQKLKCEIEPLLMDGEEANWIKAFTNNTHGETHNSYKLNVEQIFKVVRDSEGRRFEPFKGEKNRMLLWHGSRLCNWTGILSQGLRIAPPEAPVTGYMFGKGVYFADMVTKSANYCYPNYSDPVGLLLLCEVALGGIRELFASDYNADRLPKGKLSTKGVGRIAPDPKSNKVLPDGVVVPLGKPLKESVGNSNPGIPTYAVLQYNEYIVYDTAQIRMRYLLKVRFDYKR